MATEYPENLRMWALLVQVYRMLSESVDAPTPSRAAVQTLEAAEYISVSAATLRRWRAEGVGSNYVEHESLMLYRIEDLNGCLRKHLTSKR